MEGFGQTETTLCTVTTYRGCSRAQARLHGHAQRPAVRRGHRADADGDARPRRRRRAKSCVRTDDGRALRPVHAATTGTRNRPSEAWQRRRLPHRRHRLAGRGRLLLVRGPRGRRDQVLRLPHRALRDRKRHSWSCPTCWSAPSPAPRTRCAARWSRPPSC